MGWADFAAGLIAPVGNLIDGAWYTEQERARDQLAADSIAAQQQIARAQAEAMTASARYGALATETKAQGMTTAVLIGAGALVAVAAVFALTR